MTQQVQVRRGTAASATSNNPTLASGEIGFETDTGRLKIGDGSTAWTSLPYANVQKDIIGVTIDGGGSALTTGAQKAYASVPYDCTITSARVLADQSGSIVVDVWKDTYANFPATDADSITASAPPTLSTAQKSEDATLTGWTTSLNEGDVLEFNIDSATTVTRVRVELMIERRY